MDNILKILEEKYTLITKKEIKFELSSNLITDLGMTSIIFVYFMLLIEEEFNINLEEVSYLTGYRDFTKDNSSKIWAKLVINGEELVIFSLQII